MKTRDTGLILLFRGWLRPAENRGLGAGSRVLTGFTILEILIAAAVLALLLGLVYGLLSLGMGQFYRGGRKTDAMQTGLLVLEELGADLDRLVSTPASSNNPVRISQDGRAMSFAVLDREKSSERVIRGGTVTWTLQKSGRPGCVIPARNGQPRPGWLLKDWEFVFFSRQDPDAHGRDYVRLAVEATGADGAGTHGTVRILELRDARLMSAFAGTYPVIPGSLLVPDPPKPPELGPELMATVREAVKAQ